MRLLSNPRGTGPGSLWPATLQRLKTEVVSTQAGKKENLEPVVFEAWCTLTNSVACLRPILDIRVSLENKKESAPFLSLEVIITLA